MSAFCHIKRKEVSILENPIESFKSITTLEPNKIYTTKSALGYFRTIKSTLENIASHLIEAKTGFGACTPGNMEFYFQLSKNIDVMENFFTDTNKNDRNKVEKILDIKNILIPFDTIKTMMLGSDKDLRQDAYQLFIRATDLYSDNEIQEFVSLLNEDETKNIARILNAEGYLIGKREKKLTNTSIGYYVNEKMKLFQKRKATSKEYIDDEEAR